MKFVVYSYEGIQRKFHGDFSDKESADSYKAELERTSDPTKILYVVRCIPSLVSEQTVSQ